MCKSRSLQLPEFREFILVKGVPNFTLSHNGKVNLSDFMHILNMILEIRQYLLSTARPVSGLYKTYNSLSKQRIMATEFA